MLHFFPWKKPFFQKSASFCWNVECVRSCWMPFPKKVLLSAEMLNMLNYFASSWSLLASHRPQKIQHIQHIQHFSRKKHIFQTLDPTWSNIFNISAERSTFLIPLAFFLLKCWICWIFWGVIFWLWKGPQTAEIEHFYKKVAQLCRNNVILHHLLTMGLENFAQIRAKSENPFFTIKLG